MGTGNEINKKSFGRRIYSFAVDQKFVPWRVSNGLELWMERWVRTKIPFLYRLVRFRRAYDIVTPVSSGPKHHFFGYYDKSPWNFSENLLLAHEVAFNKRPPTANDPATIGVIRLNEASNFEPITQTYAWNWQQGSMLQWHPADPDNLILYNDRRDSAFVGIVKSIKNNYMAIYSRPFYAIAPDGSKALSLNFSRLHEKRPGYGYAGIPDRWSGEKFPDDDGIYHIDMETRESRLIVSLRQLALNNPTSEMQDTFHWVNHIQISTNGRRFAFLHCWRIGQEKWGERLYTSNMDGSGLHCLLDGNMVSHYDWMDNHRLLAWASLPYSEGRFVLCEDANKTMQVIGDGILVADGHCSFSPDRKWITTDTYPDRHGIRTLMLFRMYDSKKIDLARLFSHEEIWGEIRCDLHPRWSRDGKQICVDSVHTGERQMYILGLKGIIQ